MENKQKRLEDLEELYDLTIKKQKVLSVILWLNAALNFVNFLLLLIQRIRS